MNFNLLKALRLLPTRSSQAASSHSEPSNAPPRSLGAAISPSAGYATGYMDGQAIIDQEIQPQKAGRVRFRGSYWSARCQQDISLAPGYVVDIVGLEGITLLVEPAFLLRASEPGLNRIRQACADRGWDVTEPDWLVQSAESITVMTTATGQPEPIAVETWQRFVQGKPIYITAFQACCQRLGLNWQEIVRYGQPEAQETIPGEWIESIVTNVETIDPDPGLNFVGRDRSMADLRQMVQSGAKAITIVGEGGVGKTTLAQQFFPQSGFTLVLECWMGKRTQTIIPADSLINDWLRNQFGETARLEFHVALERLRQNLQEVIVNGEVSRVGILIDNLETALDEDGRFVEAHPAYRELLAVLTDPSVQSVTLLTSRIPLREDYSTLRNYPLFGLDEMAWQQFFGDRQIQVDTHVLGQIHSTYRGNAKAMTIISSIVSVDYDGGLSAFWQDYQTALSQNSSLDELVKNHFQRLQQLYPEAYRLICRMGCYRYQDQITVPLAGVTALLWDVPATRHTSILRFLRDLFLLEYVDGGYQLHPIVRSTAANLLRSSPDWAQTNRQAAVFWTEQVQAIETPEDALTALEAYYHCLQMEDFEGAAQVLLYPRDNRWERNEPLGVAFYRLGLLRRMTKAIMRILDRIPSGYALSKLNNILGDLYWLRGNIHPAIAAHQRSRTVAIENQIRDLEIVSLFNIGLCRIDLWELDEAEQLFSTVDDMAANSEYRMFAIGAWFCLAWLKSCRGERQEAIRLAQRVSNEFAAIGSSSWSRGYSLIFLGSTLKHLGDFDKARQMYNLAKDYAEQSNFIQVKARALNGLAELCREQQDFDSAIDHQLAAKALLSQIEAKSDLAEVCYQLGLTYQQINHPIESQANFQQAIRLFEQIQAPKQIEKVRSVRSV